MTSWLLLNIKALLPFVLLSGAGTLLLLPAAFASHKKEDEERPLNKLILPSLIVLLVAAVIAWRAWLSSATIASGMVLSDRIAYGFDLLFIVVAFLTLLLSRERQHTGGDGRGEYCSLILLSTAGMSLMAHSGDLVLLFLGLEIMTISAYILCGFQRGDKSSESALKYFILSAFASAFLLYGIALIYGATGTTNLSGIADAAPNLFSASEGGGTVWLVRLSLALLLIGFGFKIAAAPFHFWTPDVYEGAPTPVTSFMATGIKAAGFIGLLRIAVPFASFPDLPWSTVIAWLSVLTMSVGNLVALKQTNIKRMLAYSSIAHAGYALVGVAAATQNGVFDEGAFGSVLFYLIAYSFMTTGAFAILIIMGRKGSESDEIGDYAGLGKSHPALAAMMAVFMISLTGIPPTVGFVGKFYIFKSAIDVSLVWLVIVAAVNSAISAFYYLNVISMMYFQKERGYKIPQLSYSLLMLVGFIVLGVLYFGLFPDELYVIAKESFKAVSF